MFKYSFPTSESVYNFNQNEESSLLNEQKKERKPLYRSKHSAKVREEFTESKSWPSKTLGVPQLPAESPDKFLKKHSRQAISARPKSVAGCIQVEKGSQAGETSKKEEDCSASSSQHIRPKTCQRMCEGMQKPAIFPASMPLQILVEENKDFIKRNAQHIKNNSRLISQPSTLRYVDMSNGNTQVWYNSGLAPHHIHRKTFGKVPAYLTKRKTEVLEAEQAQKQDATERDTPSVQKLEKAEICKMIAGLKENWNEVFTLYQRLPLLIDTPGKIKRKLGLEAQLKKLEKDIQTLQRHDFIYIADVPHAYYISSLKRH